MESSSPSERRAALTKQILLLAAFFFAVSSLVPTAYGRMLLVWPVLSPIGAVIAVLSGWITLKLLLKKGDPVLRWTAGATALLWLPCWLDYGKLVVGDGRDPWQMLSDGFRMWMG